MRKVHVRVHKSCLIAGCERKRQWRGLCRPHQRLWQVNGEMMPLLPPTTRSVSPELLGRTPRRRCGVGGCECICQWRGLCTTHRRLYEEAGQMVPLRPGTPRSVTDMTCVAPGCGAAVSTKGYCKPHYDAVVVRGAPPDHPIRRLYARLPGDVRHEENGYVIVLTPDHPSVYSNGYYPEHRLVMESVLGRYLTPDESVHHKNGVRSDNRPENLELWSRFQPAGQRVEDLVVWAEEILRRYSALTA